MSLSEQHQQAIGRVFDRGYQVLGSPQRFNRWLTALNNQSPLHRLDTVEGTTAVLEVLGRLEHGVYS